MTFKHAQLGLNFNRISLLVGTFIPKFHQGSLQTHGNYHVEAVSKLHPGTEGSSVSPYNEQEFPLPVWGIFSHLLP